jgi:putative membrane protein
VGFLQFSHCTIGRVELPHDTVRLNNTKDFDASYDQTQVKAHQDAVALFDAYAKNGDNAELKGWAFRTPHLREHLSMAEKLK